jgi:hypothetical protein
LGITHNDLLLSVKINETINPNIPNSKFDVNDLKYLSNVIPFDSPGKINKTPNQPEVRFNIIDLVTSKKVS